MLILVASTLATKSASSVAGSSLQTGRQLDLDLDGLGAAPSFKNPGIDSLVVPTPPKRDSADSAAPQNAQTDTKGELVKDASDATTTSLPPEAQEIAPTPDSFFMSSWPYFMVGLALLGWVLYQRTLKKAPSFKHHKIPPKSPVAGSQQTGQFKASQRFQKTEETESQTEAKIIADADQGVNNNPPESPETGSQKTGQFKIAKRFQKPDNPEQAESEASTTTAADETNKNTLPTSPKSGSEKTDAQPTGQFKIATRFQKPDSPEKAESEASTVTKKTNSVENKSIDEQEFSPPEDGRPADDEFELGMSSFSDSDIIDEQEAAEIIKRVDSRQTELRGPRFKTKVEQSKVSPKDSN